MVTITTNNGKVCLTSGLLVDKETAKKLDNKELQSKIDAVCEDLHLDAYYVKIDDNIPFSVVDRYVTETNEAGISALTETHQKFIHAIENMELPNNDAKEPEPGHAQNNEDVDEHEFITELLKGIEADDPHILGAVIIADPGHCIPITIPVGTVSPEMLKRICETYARTNGWIE